jgi:flagellar biosynthesis/type III secretory pathway protein FliH
MAAGSTPDNYTLSVETYSPSEYEETSWPRVEVESVESTFRLANFEVVAQPVFTTDPMFADFSVESPFSSPQPAAESSFVSDPLQSVANASDQSVSELDGNNHVHVNEDLENHHQENNYDEMQGVAEDSAKGQDSESFSPTMTEELEPSEEPVVPVVGQQTHEDALATAREEAYARGVAETRQEVDATCAQVREHFTELLEDFKAQSREMLQDYERKAVELAFLIARRMVGTVAETQRECVLSVIREAMQSVGSATIEAVRVSPADFDFLVNQGAAAQLKAASDAPPVFVSDETIKAGCVIKTSSGEVDFDLEAAWNRLYSKMVQGPQS